MNAIGINTYLGGMEEGVRRANFNVIADIEVWNTAIKARKITSDYGFCRACSREDLQGVQADLVFSNPPCSRFSLSASARYGNREKASMHAFTEVKHAANLAISTGARALWWETGPLAWTSGRDLVSATHDYLKKEWGRCASLLMFIDLRWCGVPQRRPRCHIMHFNAPAIRTLELESRWPIEGSVYEWVRSRLASNEAEERQYRHRHCAGDPLHTARAFGKLDGFRQRAPQIIQLTDSWVPAILGDRSMVWENNNRWVTIEEWATLMAMPAKMMRVLAERMTDAQAMSLLSKGVSPSVTQYVAEHVVQPTLNELNNTSKLVEKGWAKGISTLELRLPDGRRLGRRVA